MDIKIFCVLLACAISCVSAQSGAVVQGDCRLASNDYGYTCYLSGINLAPEDTLNIIANHEGEFTDDDVVDVYFYASNVSYVPNVVFTKFPNTQILNMNTIGLQNIPAGAFAGANHLERFSAMFNDLSSIGEGAFRGLDNIHEIDLGFNEITDIHLNGFEGLQNLQIIDFNENPLTTETLIGRFVHLTSLRSLYLGGNRLTHLPANFFGLPELRFLFIYRNAITTIHPDALIGMPHMDSMLLFLNNVGSISGEIFREMLDLQSLDVTLMGLTAIAPTDFNGLANLRELFINDNLLVNLVPTIFNQLVSLEVLIIDNNQISTIHPTTFWFLRNLWFLAIDNNNITNLHENTFQDLESLQRIYMYENEIVSLDGRLFRNCARLQYILMHTNRINAIERNFIEALPQLSRLDLTGNVCTNQLFTLQGGTLSPPITTTLTTCFNNFDTPQGVVRRFHMVLEGDLTLTEL